MANLKKVTRFFYFQLILLININDLNLFVNFVKLVSFSIRFKDLVKVFWNNNKTNPNPNSIADKTRKKKVSDKRFKLSKTRPIKERIA